MGRLSFILLTMLLLASCGAMDSSNLETRNGVVYEKGSVRSYTGKAVTYYPDTGKERRIYQEGYYEMGLKDGVWTVYKWNGAREEIPYRLGKLHGRLVRYHPNGVHHIEENYVNGVLHGMTGEWDPNDELIVRKNYKNGKQVLMPSEEEQSKDDRSSDEFWGKIKRDFDKGYLSQ